MLIVLKGEAAAECSLGEHDSTLECTLADGISHCSLRFNTVNDEIGSGGFGRVYRAKTIGESTRMVTNND